MDADTCASCGKAIAYEEPTLSRQPCLHCGETGRRYQRASAEDVVLRDCLEFKLDDSTLPSKNLRRRTRVEGKSGYERSVKRQKLVCKDRLIDRRNDRYREKVVDSDTGKIIHETVEPLSQHRGHGSAKQPKQP